MEAGDGMETQPLLCHSGGLDLLLSPFSVSIWKIDFERKGALCCRVWERGLKSVLFLLPPAKSGTGSGDSVSIR